MIPKVKAYVLRVDMMIRPVSYTHLDVYKRQALHESGFANVVMMTGDNRRTAEAVAAEVGVDAVYALSLIHI